MTYNHRDQTCTGKIRYASFREAADHLARKRGHARHRGRHFRDMTSYHCQFCGAYHNGHVAELGEPYTPMRVLRRQWLEIKQALRAGRKARSWRNR